MSIKHHFHGCQKRRWYVLRLLSGAISSTWLYPFFLSFTVFSLFWNCPSVFNDARRVGGRSFQREVRRQQNYVFHTLTFLPKAPSDRRVTQNGENDGQCWQRQKCTFLPDKMELLRVHTCRRWYTTCTLFSHCLIGSQCRSSHSVAVMRSYFRFRISWAAEFKTDCNACRLAALI